MNTRLFNLMMEETFEQVDDFEESAPSCVQFLPLHYHPQGKFYRMFIRGRTFDFPYNWDVLQYLSDRPESIVTDCQQSRLTSIFNSLFDLREPRFLLDRHHQEARIVLYESKDESRVLEWVERTKKGEPVELPSVKTARAA